MIARRSSRNGIMAKDPRALRTEGTVTALPVVLGDDASLVRAMIEQHPAAARAVYRRFSTLVRTLVVRVLGPDMDVEDHVQDTFLRLFEHVSELRDPTALSGFVVGIAMRVTRGELRRRRLRRWLRLTTSGRVPETVVPHEDLVAREAVVRLYGVLDRIDDDARLAFVLRHVQGMDLADVASALGCSLATVKRRLDHAAKRIQLLGGRDEALAPYLRGGGDV
jgi:RNA polymerase sigma-70 factor, ECF subfamily